MQYPQYITIRAEIILKWAVLEAFPLGLMARSPGSEAVKSGVQPWRILVKK